MATPAPCWEVAASPRFTDVSGSRGSPVSGEFAESDPRREPSCSPCLVVLRKNQVPAFWRCRQSDERDREARSFSVCFQHCLRQLWIKRRVIYCIQPELRERIAFAKLAQSGKEILASIA